MNWITSHAAFLITAGLLVGGALNRALPAKSSDFHLGQFILDWVKGILGALPSNAPKLSNEQRASLTK